jgi:hypothetical protein
LKKSTKLFADETTAPALYPGRGCTNKGQLCARDEQSWGVLPASSFARRENSAPSDQSSAK